jgi:hypothetical protein
MDIYVPAVLRDVIVSYAIQDMQTLLKDLGSQMALACGFNYLSNYQVPEMVQAVMTY